MCHWRVCLYYIFEWKNTRIKQEQLNEVYFVLDMISRILASQSVFPRGKLNSGKFPVCIEFEVIGSDTFANEVCAVCRTSSAKWHNDTPATFGTKEAWQNKTRLNIYKSSTNLQYQIQMMVISEISINFLNGIKLT